MVVVWRCSRPAAERPATECTGADWTYSRGRGGPHNSRTHGVTQALIDHPHTYVLCIMLLSMFVLVVECSLLSAFWPLPSIRGAGGHAGPALRGVYTRQHPAARRETPAFNGETPLRRGLGAFRHGWLRPCSTGRWERNDRRSKAKARFDDESKEETDRAEVGQCGGMCFHLSSS